MSGKVLESDKIIVYNLCTTFTHHVVMDAYSLENVFAFGEKAGIINNLNYMTVMNRLKNALESLYEDGKCERLKYGKGYSYNFIKSL